MEDIPPRYSKGLRTFYFVLSNRQCNETFNSLCFHKKVQ